MQDVSEVVVDSSDARQLAEPQKDLAGSFRGRESAIILAGEIQGLDRTAEGPGGFLPKFQGFEELAGPVVVFSGRPVFTGRMKRVPLGAQRQRQVLLAPEAPRDEQRRLRQVKSLTRVHAGPRRDHGRKLAHGFPANEARMTAKETPAGRAAADLGELRDQILFADLASRGGHQWKPAWARWRRRRSMHFSRVNPIEPTASPSSLATSASGRA